MRKAGALSLYWCSSAKGTFALRNLFRCALQQWINKKERMERAQFFQITSWPARFPSQYIIYSAPCAACFWKLNANQDAEAIWSQQTPAKVIFGASGKFVSKVCAAWPNSFAPTGEHKFIYYAQGKMMIKFQPASHFMPLKEKFIFKVSSHIVLAHAGGVNQY